ncbi:MAG: type II toxin-antitoxin system YafQ family toxin [Bacteroidota bacterium]
MFQLVFTNKFKKDVKLLQKRGYDMEVLKNAINSLEKNGILPVETRSHKLSGDFSGFWEAHLKPDWLILWSVSTADNEIWLTRTGTHADLF